jgi:NAD(P)-dependent dehydrogenase (short-subunit alcohol dehydrogenase family)
VGRAIAESLARDGWRIAVHYRESQAGAQEVVQGIVARGGEAAPFAADLADPRACDALVDAAYEHFGQLDLLVNSAAGMVKTRLGHTTAAEFDAIIAVNLRAPFLLAQAAARLMPAGSSIVCIADHMAVEPWPSYSVHGIAKAGVMALTRHLAAALAPDIRVNAIAPGAFASDMNREARDHGDATAQTIPARRIGKDEDMAAAAIYLSSNASDYVVGHTLVVDGGVTLARG